MSPQCVTSVHRTSNRGGEAKCWKRVLMLFLFLLWAFVSATFVTKADVEKCIQSSEDLECSERLVVGVSVSYGLTASLDAVTVNTIMKDGEPQALEETIKIDIEKTPPYLNYPLVYWHTVPYFPHEELIKVKNSLVGVQKCVDAPTAEYPTCGWTMTGGYQITDSQGFCCNKGTEILTDGGGWWRGEARLGEQSTLFNSFSTGHCLRMGDLMYHGYEIDSSSRHFKIRFTVTKGDSVNTFSVDPQTYVHFDEATGIKATLIGEFADYVSAPELDNYILYVPASPLDHALVMDKMANLLLVPREEQSKDGSECDKVGISFNEFRKQGALCSNTQVGECLGNQLYHKHSDDLASLASDPDRDTTYLVSGMRRFKNAMSFERGSQLVLKYRVTSIQNSLISLEMDMAQIRVVSTESVGIIVEAYVKTFESMSRDGTMVIKIQNVGDLRTNYIVTVSECNMNIVGGHIPAQAVTLNPGEDEPETLFYNIMTSLDLEQSNECMVRLKSPEDKLYDSVLVKFDTLKHRSDYSWELQMKNEATTVKEDTMTGLGSCECGFFDIACKFVKMCWVDIIIMVLIVLGVIALAIGLVIFFMCGGGSLLPQICCCCCKACKCCMGFVACFTKFFEKGAKGAAKVAAAAAAATPAKAGASPVAKRSPARKRRAPRRRVQRRRRRKARRDYSSSEDSSEEMEPMYETLSERDVDDFCDEGRVCYMNINSTSDLGREMLGVMKQAMPMRVGDRFCLVGTIRYKHGTHQFIVHEDLLHQTFFYDRGEWIQADKGERIEDRYRGYSLQLEHVLTTISEKPWPAHCVLNQPLEL